MSIFKRKIGMIFLIATTALPAFASIEQWPLRHQGEVRYLRMIKVYDIGLYSPTKLTEKNVLSTSISKCLKLDYAVNLSVDKFRLATSTVLNRQHSKAFLKEIKKPLDELQKSYKPVKKGDNYILCYNGKTKKLSLALNKKKLFETASAKLASAYLGIWLSKNKPISAPLYQSFFNQNNK